MKLIELSKTGKNKGKYSAMVDDDVFEEVNKFNWSYNSGYANRDDYSTGKQKHILLHRYIYELKYGDIPEGLEVEHWDESPLNCQISNLRLASHAENMCNKTIRKDNKSGVKGICKVVQKDKRHPGWKLEKWYAKITKDKKAYTKRFPFTDEGFEQAQEWIKNMSLKIQGEFSIYNKDK